MIASLPMYDHPALRGAHDAYWAHIHARLGRGPAALHRGTNPWDDWRARDLLLSQTCGLPYRACLHGQVQLVGTPDFGLPGCPAGHYNSVLIARKADRLTALEELEGLRLAYNEPLSQSGWAAPNATFEEQGLALGPTLQSGAHAASARMVAEGLADFAAIDAQTWRILQRHEPLVTSQLAEVARTKPTPALPYITSRGEDASALFDAIRSALEEMPQNLRVMLDLQEIVFIAPEAYLAQPTPEAPQTA